MIDDIGDWWKSREEKKVMGWRAAGPGRRTGTRDPGFGTDPSRHQAGALSTLYSPYVLSTLSS